MQDGEVATISAQSKYGAIESCTAAGRGRPVQYAVAANHSGSNVNPVGVLKIMKHGKAAAIRLQPEYGSSLKGASVHCSTVKSRAVQAHTANRICCDVIRIQLE